MRSHYTHPVRLHLAEKKTESFGDVLLTLRLKKNLTQKKVAQMIGVYISPRGTTLISDYEKGRNIPHIFLIPKLSEALGINADDLFKMALKEHYNRFLQKHQKAFHIYINGRANGIEEKILLKKMGKSTRYYFCTKGKIYHKFPLFQALIKNTMNSKGIEYQDLIKYLRSLNVGFHNSYLFNTLYGSRPPTVKLVIALSNYLGLDPFEMYKGVVKEKSIGHIENAKRQWEVAKWLHRKEKDVNVSSI